ncbi:MAG TPA: hypothetical protein ENK32_08055 [Anaerolineae bacterium]|nr:hypothetical protein [Anaerolineae bacterium]
MNRFLTQAGPYLALLVLAAAGYAIKDSQGMQFAWLGLFLWSFSAVFIFVLTLVYFAQFVTPLSGSDGHWQGLRLLFRALFNPGVPPPAAPPSAGRKKRRKAAAPKPKEAAGQLPASFTLLYAGLLRPYQAAVVVTKKGAYVGPKGPGFVILERNEKIGLLVDLRRQSRTHPIQTSTRDGIKISADVTVEFQVKQPETPDDNILYPYDPRAVKQVFQTATIDADGVVHPWTDQPAPQAAALALTELSHYLMDNILRPGYGPNPLKEAAEKAKEKMIERNADAGIAIHTVKISGLKFEEEIRRQQMEEWTARWRQKMRAETQAHQVEVDQLLKKARARVQVEMIERIAAALDAAQQEDETTLVQIITLRLIEAWEEAVSAGVINSAASQQVMDNLASATSEQIRMWSQNPPPPQIAPSIQGGKEP